MSRCNSGPCVKTRTCTAQVSLWCRHLQEQHLLLFSIQAQVQLKSLWCGVDTSRCYTGIWDCTADTTGVDSKNCSNKEMHFFWFKAKKIKYICTSKDRRKTNLFVPKLSKEWRLIKVFVPQPSTELRKTNAFVPQLSKGRRKPIYFFLNYQRNEDKKKYLSSTIKGTKKN